MSRLKKGKSYGDGWKRKISENHADVSGKNNPMWGKKRPQSVKDATSKANKGRIKTKEELEKLRLANTGSKRSLKTILKMRASAPKGDKSSNWKGGVTEKHRLIRTSSKYRVWREQVFERDNYTCQTCGQRGGKLQADHIIPLANDKNKIYELSNGRTLCIDCHKKTDTYGFKLYWKKFYEKFT